MKEVSVFVLESCGKDFDRLKKIVGKVKVKDEPSQKEADTDVELDEKGFPKMLESPPAVKDPLEKKGRSCVGSPLEKRGASCVGSPLKKGAGMGGSPLKKRLQAVPGPGPCGREMVPCAA